MKKIIILVLSIFLITGCSNKIKFKNIEKDTTHFHQIKVAEKIDDGIIYLNGDKLVYEKNGNIIELADNIRSLWRENNDIYYDSYNTLYTYNFETNETKKMVENPHTILGKYDHNIISYSGRTIYSINGTTKTKLFKNGYYLNRAVLYKNKVYGIPATNVYEYNLSTLKVKKITNNPRNSFLKLVSDELWIGTVYKNKTRSNYVYSKMTEDGLKEIFTIHDIESISDEKFIQDGVIIATTKSLDESTKNNKLLYVQNGKVNKIDKNYNYNMVGIFRHKLCYYKNQYTYGTEQNNLKTFYLYDGNKSIKAFDLEVGFYETINGYEYDDGLLIEVSYESSTVLYKYDGKNIEEIKVPTHFYRMIDLDVIDHNAYIRYSDGEESMKSLGTIIDLK